MINANRIVPVTKTDLLTLYANILTIAGTTVTKVDANDASGVFEISEGSGNLIASEPVNSCDFGEDVTAAVLYFIPGYDYTGFSVNGTAVETSGDDVDADGVSLYTATLDDGAVTIAQVGF